MTIEQTVDIPASHRLVIDVPREVPAGKTILTFTPVTLAGSAQPKAGDGGKIRLTKPMIDELLQSGTLRSLTGLLRTDMSSDEIRAERLKKHDRSS